MKISELISQLEFLKDRHGDNEIAINVRDYYSRYGSRANFAYNPERHKENKWEGTFTNGNLTTLTIHLLPEDEKNPKITFRK